jgi:hypothetical protein
MLPWLRDHLNTYYDPNKPGYGWIGQMLKAPMPRLCPYWYPVHVIVITNFELAYHLLIDFCGV